MFDSQRSPNVTCAERLCSDNLHGKPKKDHDGNQYTSALKEMGDAECILPVYNLISLSLCPPKWGATVHFKGISSYAEAYSKKAAKHSASKALWLKMGQNVIK